MAPSCQPFFPIHFPDSSSSNPSVQPVSTMHHPNPLPWLHHPNPSPQPPHPSSVTPAPSPQLHHPNPLPQPITPAPLPQPHHPSSITPAPLHQPITPPCPPHPEPCPRRGGSLPALHSLLFPLSGDINPVSTSKEEKSKCHISETVQLKGY